MLIQVKRGLEADRLSVTPDVGEPLFTTDTKKLYIGDGLTPGGIEVDMNGYPAPVQSVAGRDGDVVLTKSDVGLTDVDNTADLNKPISAAAQAALDAKANSASVTSHTANVSNPHSVTKAQIGLPDVDNVSAAALRDRSTHTGTQSTATIAGLDLALAGKQPSGSYATTTALTDGLADKADTSHTHAQSDITGLTAAIAAKQDTLVSATNIKTINSVSLLGSGNIDIAGGSGAVDSVNGATGVVVLDTDDVSEGTNKYVTAADITKLSNLSGTNTGDQDLSSYATTSAVTTALSGKANTTHTHTASQITDFDTEVANNSAVAANTAKVGVTTQISNLSEDATPQLGGNLDGQTYSLTNIWDGGFLGSVTVAGTVDGRDVATDGTKLDGIATGATANSSDATLLARANHTGTQTASTISDFSTAVAATASVTANTAKVTNATHTGDATGATALTLATVNSNVGLFGSATQVATFTVNGKGLTTAAGNTSIQIAESQVTNLVTDLAGKAASTHTHAESDITGLTTDLSNKANGTMSLTVSASVPSSGTGANGDVCFVYV